MMRSTRMHHSVKISQMHLWPKFGQNRIDGCTVICHKRISQVNFNIWLQMTLACDPWRHYSAKVSQMHLWPKFSHNKINGCKVICHKKVLQHFNIWPQMTFDLSMWPLMAPQHEGSPNEICDPSLVTIGWTVAKLCTLTFVTDGRTDDTWVP